jgi:hypothetical protein
MVPLWADGGDVGTGSARLLIYHHKLDHFCFDMCLNILCSRFLMLDLDTKLFGFDVVSTGHFCTHLNL